MNDTKPGIYTTEFWLTAVSNVGGALIALLAAYGLVQQEQANLWLALLQALAVALIPAALAFLNARYISARAEIKRKQ